MTFYRTVDIAWPIWAEFRVVYPHIMLLGKHEFREYRCSGRHTIRNAAVHNILSIFCAMFVRFGQNSVCVLSKHSWRDSYLRENRRSKNYTLTWSVNKFLSVLSTSMSDLREFGKCGIFLVAVWNYTKACTAKVWHFERSTQFAVL
jgi:hypothetical protein